MQPGDVLCTYADVDDLKMGLSLPPIDKGLHHFVQWYQKIQ